MKCSKWIKVLLTAVAVMGLVGSVFAEDLSAADRKKLESERKTLEGKLVAARASSETAIEARLAEIDETLSEPSNVEVGLSLDLASAYVFRGVTFNDGLVLQPGLEIGGLPVTFGVWANMDIGDYDDALKAGQFSEIDIYLGYDLPLNLDPCGLSLAYCEYTYPNAASEADRELSLGLSCDVVLSPSLTVYYGIDGGISKDLLLELSIGHDFDITDSISGSAGAVVSFYAPGADGADSGFNRFELSLSGGYDIFSLGITYAGQIDDKVLSDEAYDTSVIASLGVAQSF